MPMTRYLEPFLLPPEERSKAPARVQAEISSIKGTEAKLTGTSAAWLG